MCVCVGLYAVYLCRLPDFRFLNASASVAASAGALLGQKHWKKYFHIIMFLFFRHYFIFLFRALLPELILTFF